MKIDHIYISTYCLHAEHENCRRTCKVCQAFCHCDCHVTTKGRK